MRGKCIVQAFGHAEFKLSGITGIRLLYRFRNGVSFLNSGFKPGLFRIKSADKNIFKSVGAGYAARKFRIVCGIAAFILSNYQLDVAAGAAVFADDDLAVDALFELGNV